MTVAGHTMPIAARSLALTVVGAGVVEVSPTARAGQLSIASEPTRIAADSLGPRC